MKAEEMKFSSESGFVAGDFSSDTCEPLLIPINNNGATCDIFRKIDGGKTTVIKRLRSEHLSNPVYHELFRKEYETGCVLDNPNIVRYLDFSDEADDCHIEMEYVDGDTLKERLLSDPEYFSDRNNFNKFLMQLLDGLHYLHSRQIVHLDLKPDNIMLSKVNNDVKILDLGFCYSDAYQTSIGRTTAFAAPEQLDGSGDVDARTDIYCIGVILNVILEITKSKDRRLHQIVEKCVKEEKADRYQNITEIFLALNGGNRFVKYSVWIIVLVVLLVIISSFFNLPRRIHHAIYGCDIQDSAYCWDIISDDSLICEVFGNHSLSKPHFEYSDMTIGATLHYSNKTYRVVQIADSAFAAREHIIKIGIDEGVERIGNSAFIGCSRLRVASIPSSVKEIGHDAFSWCEKLESVALPEGITTIERAAFHHTALSSIIIPEGVVSIGKDAFVGCENLKEVSLPSSLTNLGRGVFYKCDSLEELTIPKNVRRIGEYILMKCPNFKRLYNHAQKPQTVFDLFDDAAKVTVFVPSTSVTLYKNAPYWKECNIQSME